MKYKRLKSEFKDYFFEIVDQARNGITISDPNQEDNPLIFVNQAFCDIFGYTYDEAIGRNCRFLQKDDRDQSNLQQIRDAVTNQTETTAVLRNYTKDGTLIYNEIKVSPIFDKKTKKLKYFLGIQKNITESMMTHSSHNLKKIVQEIQSDQELNSKDVQTLIQEFQVYQAELLAQNEELVDKDKKLLLLNAEFEALFKEAPMPLFLVDEQLQIKKYNTSADEYFYFTDSKVSIKSLFHFVQKKSIQKLLHWIQTKEYENHHIEIDMHCHTSEVRRFKIKAKRYNLDESLLVFTLADIQFEYEVQTNLEKKVNQQLEKALEQEKFIAEQSKLASMGEMIDAIAHQWKQPLGVVSMRTSFLLEMNKDQKSVPYEDIKECQESVLFQINHLVETLEQFRDFLRPNKQTQEFSIKKMIDSVLVLVKDDIVKHSISVHTYIPQDLIYNGIENELKHVILNIVSNAKEIFFERDIQNKEIFITVSFNDELVEIAIDDNAGGIPEDIIGQLFENHISGRQNGTGIGLYMSKQIITKMAGTIEASNIEYPDGTLGARFTVTLPINV